ncbi:VIB-1 [Verticillium alfalfae VaMs.102]|uniref:VIB-1 n=1 Tax=Verticillium alfalfae (strain VaMs.102 / ATCC MYA-4576 / FGSC 10136) TaxID=526221 RepID=C9SGH2_VERA1|nr:VIB-1 [Verticillium alfalfae VaMs.102]EEY18122.1 VIB-1 [Verticillium alfalfae VaMs.102]
MELSAQLHGMFFLSEMPSGATEGSVLQPELTCYRRNLFQISGSLITARGPLSVVTETGETVPVSTTEVTVSAIESVDGHPVRLIVIPWKTPPPNSPEVAQGPDQEPPSLPLIPFQDEGPDADGEYAVYPIGWRRLQFRIATANNGRRKELQQHFVLHLKVVGTLTNGNKVVLAEATTSPIVGRGRSPRNFQARQGRFHFWDPAQGRADKLWLKLDRASWQDLSAPSQSMSKLEASTCRCREPRSPSAARVQNADLRSVAPGQQQTQARASFSYGHSTTAPPPTVYTDKRRRCTKHTPVCRQQPSPDQEPETCEPPTRSGWQFDCQYRPICRVSIQLIICTVARRQRRRAPGPWIWRGLDVDSSFGTAKGLLSPFDHLDDNGWRSKCDSGLYQQRQSVVLVSGPVQEHCSGGAGQE